MTVIKAHFDGRVLVPDEPVDLPVGSPLEVRIVPLTAAQVAATPLTRLAQRMAKFPTNPALPTDAASQHDHYLYGLPKRP